MPAGTSPTRHIRVAAAAGGAATVETDRSGRTDAWPLSGSFLLHVVLVAAIVALPQKRWVRPPQQTILVEILTPQHFRMATGTDPQIVPEAPQPVFATPSPQRFEAGFAAMPVPKAPEAPGMIRVTRILSGEALADPRSRQARTALRQLSLFDRREQLCNLEAMEQVHAWDRDYEPERLVAYAMADTEVTGNVVLADGAAFRSKRQWYNLKYRCEVTSDLVEVVGFEFQVGEPIPRTDWQAHYLPERY